MKPKRKRPVLNTTIGEQTWNVLAKVSKEVALPNFGVAVDYIVNDWVGLKQTALTVAQPEETPA